MKELSFLSLSTDHSLAPTPFRSSSGVCTYSTYANLEMKGSLSGSQKLHLKPSSSFI